jgi:hypothetical protein
MKRSHEQSTDNKKSPSRISRIGGALTKLGEGLTAEGMAITSKLYTERVATALRHRNDSPKSLGQETGRMHLKDTLKMSELVSKSYADGSKEGITHLAFLGNNTVLGVSRTVDRYGKIHSMRVAQLPIGDLRLDDHFHTSAYTLLETQPGAINLRDAGESRVSIGRNLLKNKTGVAHNEVSAHHLDVSFTPDGSVIFEDMGSTNGTEILTVTDFNAPDFGGLEGEALRAAHGIIGTLQDQPHLWTREYADQRVIVAQ